MRTVGASAVAGLHYAYDQWWRRGTPPPRHMQPVWKTYCAVVETTPVAMRHRRVHEGHCTYVLPEELEFVTPELIQATCVLGSATDILEQLAGLEARA